MLTICRKELADHFGSIRFLILFCLIVMVALLLEITLRGYFAWQVGPRVLAYGTPWYRNAFGEYRKKELIQQYDRERVGWHENETKLNTVSKHNDRRRGYFKFFPNETKYIKDIQMQ